MSLRIGIVGLPNVGKSAMFNALTKTHNAATASYPFSTLEANKAIVPVPDARLERLAELAQPAKVTHATIEFVDIAGLVQGASRGAGLGNQFLAHIRETAALVHVVRCFDDENVQHVSAKPSPRDDVEIIRTELILADLEQVERKLERLQKQLKGDKKIQVYVDAATRLREHLNAGRPALEISNAAAELRELCTELKLLSDKQTIYAANVGEDALARDNAYVTELRALAAEEKAELVKICAKIEEELAGVSDAERAEFLVELGAEESGLDQVIHHGYAALGLISFFTAGPKEVRAWTIRAGATAPQAAGEIHTDIERGFIRAEVIPFATYSELRSEAACKAAGKMRLEGREYVVRDGDVIYFRFNV